MRFTSLSVLIASVFVIGSEAAAFASSSEAITITASHGHGASTVTFSATPSSAFATTIAPSSAPTVVPPIDGNGAFICFPIASGFAVPGLNGTVVFPPGPTGSAFPSTGFFPSGTAVTSSVFATATAVASSAFATGTAAASSAFATATAAASSAF